MKRRTRRVDGRIWLETMKSRNNVTRHHEEDYDGAVEPDELIGPATSLSTDEVTIPQ